MTESSEPRRDPWRFRITLAGLMLVMVVICLLGIPPIIAAKEKANRAICQNNLNLLYKAMHFYVSAFGKNRQFMPHTGDAFFTCLLGHGGPEHPSSYMEKIQMYKIIDINAYVCPSSGSDDTSVTPGGKMADYKGIAWSPTSIYKVDSLEHTELFSSYPIACDAAGNHKSMMRDAGGNVLRFDGSVSFKQVEEYQAAVKACSD